MKKFVVFKAVAVMVIPLIVATSYVSQRDPPFESCLKVARILPPKSPIVYMDG